MEKQTFLDFSRRTSELAAKLGVRIGDLPAKLEISRASLFSYRAGKSPISEKAWHKLELAERESGTALPLYQQITSPSTSRERELLASASLEEVLRLLPQDSRRRIAVIILDAQIDSIQSKLIAFFLDAEALADLVKTKRSKSELKFFAQKVSQSVKPSRVMLEMLVLQLRTALGLDTRSLTERMKRAGGLAGIKTVKARSQPDREKPSKKKH